jgi:hypothetical protein
MHAIEEPELAPDELDELPPRPRTRLLTPATVGLMVVLFAAGGFIGGVLVEKGQNGSSTPSLASAAARFAGAGATGATGTGGSGASRFAGLFGGGAGSRGTIGTVANIDGNKLYVTTTAGNTVEVVTTHESKVTKSQSVGTAAIHPGDSVVVSGITGSNGTVTASSITDSGAGGAAGGVGALFGGGSGASGSSSSSSSSGGTQSLFGG